MSSRVYRKPTTWPVTNLDTGVPKLHRCALRCDRPEGASQSA